MSPTIPRTAVVAYSVPEDETGLHSVGASHIPQADGECARRCADWLGGRFKRMCGALSLLRGLLWGNRDAERFQIIEPGSRPGSSADAGIMRAEYADGKADPS